MVSKATPQKRQVNHVSVVNDIVQENRTRPFMIVAEQVIQEINRASVVQNQTIEFGNVSGLEA